MENQQVKTFIEVPTLYRSSSFSSCLGSSDSIEDIFFTSFDDSCIQQSCRRKSSNNIKIFDTSSDISVDYENYSSLVKSSQVSFNETHVQVSRRDGKMNTKKYYHKSLLSMIKILKSLSVRHNNKKSSSDNVKSILRKPQEYVYIKGISGLSNRVPAASLKATVCQRCYVRSG